MSYVGGILACSDDTIGHGLARIRPHAGASYIFISGCKVLCPTATGSDSLMCHAHSLR